MSDQQTTRRLFDDDDAYEATRPAKRVRPQRRAPRRRRRGCFGCLGPAFIGTLVVILLVVGVGAVAASTILSSNLTEELQEGIDRLAVARESTRTSFETTRITDRNGELLWEIFGEGKRTYIPLSRIPQTVQQATISVEDDTFYTNKGFDEPSLIVIPSPIHGSTGT